MASMKFLALCLVLAVAGRSVADVTCQDQESECPDGMTCCATSSGYGCCPIENAVCCQDGVHCCPEKTTCDVAHGNCVQEDGLRISWQRKFPSRAIQEESSEDESLGSVTCPDKESSCPDGMTCCKLTDGSWGCCPMAEAVCCADGEHCCPKGTTCDVEEGKCNQRNGRSSPMVKKISASRPRSGSGAGKKVGDTTCPDQTSKCPGQATCCQTADGGWACCPLPQAVCCTDHLHCCPQGSQCDLEHQRCSHSDGTWRSWAKKVPSSSSDQAPDLPTRKLTTCSDEDTTCPSDSICCQSPSGQFGCCPFKDGVCCRDGAHCCPSGTSCDARGGQCTFVSEEKEFGVPWRLVAAGGRVFTGAAAAEQVGCDAESQCPKGSKCCPSGDGFGCCPDPMGVCCDNSGVCCPSGFQCGEDGKCLKSAKRVVSFPKARELD